MEFASVKTGVIYRWHIYGCRAMQVEDEKQDAPALRYGRGVKGMAARRVAGDPEIK